MAIDKKKLFDSVSDHIREDMELRRKASDSARAGATNEEAKSESKYDTRSTEESYLARGHAIQFEAMLDDLAVLAAFRLDAYKPKQPIGPGALVEVKVGPDRWAYFLLPRGGGIELDANGLEVTVVTPSSPIAQRLTGMKKGEAFSVTDGSPEGKIMKVS